MLYVIHLKDSFLFCVLTKPDVMCSPNNFYMAEGMIQSLFRSLYNNLDLCERMILMSHNDSWVKGTP